jgi:putative transcriptional regulator
MPRPLSKPRPEQGARLYDLRTAAGLSQAELAERIGVQQQTIAFWEQSDKPPRSDLLPALAEVLGVRLQDLLVVSEGSRAGRQAAGPAGKMRKVFEEASRLPRRQQEKIAEFVLAYVRQYEVERVGGREERRRG